MVDARRWMDDDFWNEGTLFCAKPYGTKSISDFEQSTGTVTVDPAFSDVLENGCRYELIADIEPHGMFAAGASIYIPAAPTTHVGEIWLYVTVAYTEEPDDAFKILGQVKCDTGIRDAWQDIRVDGMITHSGREIQFLFFELYAQRLNGNIRIDDCYLKTDNRPWGPSANNTKNYGGFPMIVRLGDTEGEVKS